MALRRALVLGADGALGSAVARAFEERGWQVVAVLEPAAGSAPAAAAAASSSFSSSSSSATSPAPASRPASEWASSLAALSASPLPALDAVVCAAGGWIGGGAGAPAGSADGERGAAAAALALAAGVERMTAVCVQPAVTAAHVACSRLRPGGLLVLVGSAAALAPTPDMLAYGAAKAATHHIVVSLTPPADGGSAAAAAAASSPSSSSSTAGAPPAPPRNTLPRGARALGVLPRVLDTPANRAFMAAGADTGSWTPCAEVAERIIAWAERRGPQPASGTLHVPETAAGRTTWRELRALYAGAP